MDGLSRTKVQPWLDFARAHLAVLQVRNNILPYVITPCLDYLTYFSGFGGVGISGKSSSTKHNTLKLLKSTLSSKFPHLPNKKIKVSNMLRHCPPSNHHPSFIKESKRGPRQCVHTVSFRERFSSSY